MDEPITDDQIDRLVKEARLRVDRTRWTGDFEAFESDPEIVLALATAVEQVRKERDAAREALEVTSTKCRESIDRIVAERDAAYAVIRLYDDGWKATHATEEEMWFKDSLRVEQWESMSPAEIVAIRRARANPEEDQP